MKFLPSSGSSAANIATEITRIESKLVLSTGYGVTSLPP